MKKNQKKKWTYLNRICLLTLSLFFVAGLSAQSQKQITGTVLDEKGESIIGASVSVKGTTNGTITDIDGRFSLSVEDNSVITISYLGFLPPQDISVTGKTDFRITLKENAALLDEIVVVGYGVVKKRDLTGSLSSVGAKVMQDKPVSNIGEALQGRAAGVQVINSGGAG